MKLHEYQSKLIFAKFGIPIPRGRVASSAQTARQIADELNLPVVIKAQVLTGGRGKAGGILLARTSQEAETNAAQILAMEIKDLPVRRVLVDEAEEFSQEIYLGIVNDRSRRCAVMMASAAGGVDIEEVARVSPEKIVRAHIDPLLGLREYQSRDLAISIDLPKELWRSFSQIAQGLWQVYQSNDATLAEINPLVITKAGKLVALDGKMVIDDNALFRHADLSEMQDLDGVEWAEIEAAKYGLSYISLDGNVGCMVNGAGLAMATMDMIKLSGGEPANFLDIGGGAGAEKVAAALRIILADSKVKSVLFNIFGGITRGDEVAKGILAALEDVKTEIPMVIRLVGTKAEEGIELLQGAKMATAVTLLDAAQQAVKMAREA